NVSVEEMLVKVRRREREGEVVWEEGEEVDAGRWSRDGEMSVNERRGVDVKGEVVREKDEWREE
uniref:hypothetical protein n=1 Tax=Paenibacillus xylanexedens TaxID=528191 RepID=UPI001C9314F3